MAKRKADETADAVDSIVEDGEGQDRLTWEEKTRCLSPIAHPLASKKLTKKIHKTIKKASKIKSLRKGVKDVQKSLRKGERGILILAGDVTPIDILSHFPVLCEDKGLQYCYVPSKQDLGQSLGTKRHTCMVLIKDHEDIKDEYKECLGKIKELPRSY